VSRAGLTKWFLPLALLVVAGLVFFKWDHFAPPLRPGTVSDPGAEKPERPQVYLGPANSIAVLSFNGDPSGLAPAFWAAGFSEEMYRLVIRAPGWRVTSRNSSFFFQDPSMSLDIIAGRLQVRYLLSGQFLLVDGRVQVAARLFDARVRKEAWTDTFEGSLDDVFAIQNEILAESMKAVMPGKHDDFPRAMPVNTEAWAAYLQGNHYRGQAATAGYEAAEMAFLAALEIQPDFTAALVGLAGLWLEKNARGDGTARLVEDARQTLEMALRYEPGLPGALGLLSYIQRNLDWNWAGALETAGQALRLSPGDPELMNTASLALFSLGQFGAAKELLSASVEQDPLNLARRLQLGLLCEFAGEYDESLKNYRQIINLNPEFPGARAYRARVKIIQDKPESALKESEQEPDPFWRRYSQILSLSALEREAEARLMLDQMILEDGDRSAYQVAEILAFRGEIDSAFAWLQRAYDQKDGGMSEIIGDWFLRNLHAEPRWDEMLDRMDLPSDGVEGTW